MAETRKNGAHESSTHEPSAREAAELLKDRMEYVKSRNLIDAVEEQRRREQESQNWGTKHR